MSVYPKGYATVILRRMSNPNDPRATPQNVPATLALVLGAATIVGFIVGIAPGLVLGFFGAHTYGAAVGSVGWGGWYFYTRWKRTGRVNAMTVAIAVAAGLGVFIAVLLFGQITAPTPGA